MTAPFVYPAAAHVWRHGPSGYAGYEDYRPWLRDEFAFRCVYCLRREVWTGRHAGYHIDHFVPVAHAPESATNYENLRYACASCNAIKRKQLVPDPLIAFVGESVAVAESGELVGQTAEARQLVELLELNDAEAVTFRSLWIDIVQLASLHDPDLYARLLGYPAELPDLSALRPPGGNTRPDGVAASHFACHHRGELPTAY